MADTLLTIRNLTIDATAYPPGEPPQEINIVKGVDSARFSPDGANVRGELGVGAAPVVLAVSRLVPIKNVGLLVDAMAIVHHSNHARYLERGRIEFLRLVGLDYAAIMKRGMQYPVLEIRTVFKKPLVFDEVIMIETAIERATRTRLDFKYRIFSVDEWHPPTLSTEPFPGNPSVTGETFHCCVNEKGRPTEAATEVVARLLELQGGIA